MNKSKFVEELTVLFERTMDDIITDWAYSTGHICKKDYCGVAKEVVHDLRVVCNTLVIADLTTDDSLPHVDIAVRVISERAQEWFFTNDEESTEELIDSFRDGVVCLAVELMFKKPIQLMNE